MQPFLPVRPMARPLPTGDSDHGHHPHIRVRVGRGTRSAPLEAPSGRPSLRPVLLRSRAPRSPVHIHPSRPGTTRKSGREGPGAVPPRGSLRSGRDRRGDRFLPGGRPALRAGHPPVPPAGRPLRPRAGRRLRAPDDGRRRAGRVRGRTALARNARPRAGDPLRSPAQPVSAGQPLPGAVPLRSTPVPRGCAAGGDGVPSARGDRRGDLRQLLLHAPCAGASRTRTRPRSSWTAGSITSWRAGAPKTRSGP